LLQDQVAVVTGAGRGIGRAIALAFAAEGAHLVLAARTGHELEAVAAEVRARDRRALAIPTDATRERDVAELARRTLAESGRVDILVNNAGWGAFKPILEMSLQEWEETIAVNLRSAFLCARALAPSMVRQGSGCILNMASMAGHTGLPEYGAYSAAKAGLLRLTQTLAAELKPIRVLALCPGPVASRLRSSHFPEEDPKSIMQPEAVADVAVFAASAAGRGISGAFLNINHY
jgi:NAD(P)-dependent dehydrogenase (short-subunit alcohol dehydrogenase family)